MVWPLGCVCQAVRAPGVKWKLLALIREARVEGVRPSTWEDPSLVQVWGPRYQTYVVASVDLAVFTLGRLPDAAKARRRAEETAARLDAHLGGARMSYADAGSALGVDPNA